MLVQHSSQSSQQNTDQDRELILWFCVWFGVFGFVYINTVKYSVHNSTESVSTPHPPSKMEL